MNKGWKGLSEMGEDGGLGGVVGGEKMDSGGWEGEWGGGWNEKNGGGWEGLDKMGEG